MLNYIASRAKNQQYFSNTTYSIIYKLIQSGKVGLFFTPTLRLTRFFVMDDNPICVVGGYDFNTKRIDIYVKWSFGVDGPINMFTAPLALACKKIFAIILSEALLMYDYNSNGELSKYPLIQKWYHTYFRGTLGDSLNRAQLSEKLAKEISEVYGERMFDNIEKNLIEGRSPAVKIKKQGMNADLDIEGIPSIVKGDKQLEDIFKDCIEDFAVKDQDKFYVDNYALKDIKKTADEFGQFGKTMYLNRDLNILPDNIMKSPDSPLGPSAKDSEKTFKRRLEAESRSELDKDFENYMNSDDQRRYAKEAQERRLATAFKDARETNQLRNDIEQEKNIDLRQRAYGDLKDMESYIKNPDKNYVDRIIDSGKHPIMEEYIEVQRGLNNATDDLQTTRTQLQTLINNGQGGSAQYNNLYNLARVQKAYCDSLWNSTKNLFRRNQENYNMNSLFKNRNSNNDIVSTYEQDRQKFDTFMTDIQNTNNYFINSTIPTNNTIDNNNVADRVNNQFAAYMTGLRLANNNQERVRILAAFSNYCASVNYGAYHIQRNHNILTNNGRNVFVNNNANIPQIDVNRIYSNNEIRAFMNQMNVITDNLVNEARLSNCSNANNRNGAIFIQLGNGRAIPTTEELENLYYRQMFLDGAEYFWHTYIPSWNTIKHWAKNAYRFTGKTWRVLRRMYSIAKDMLPLKSNMERYANQGLGFEIFGDPEYFDLAYKNNCSVKKMYKLHKGSCRKDLVYSEIYMPVSILQKMLYAQISLQNEFSPEVLYLINCANKGLESML